MSKRIYIFTFTLLPYLVVQVIFNTFLVGLQNFIKYISFFNKPFMCLKM